MHVTQLFTQPFISREKYRLRLLELKVKTSERGKNRNQNVAKLEVFTVVRLRILFFWVMGNGFSKF